MPAPPRVLVIRGGAIGDFILTLPAIRLLRDNIPGAHLEILGYKPIVALAAAGGIADATRDLDHASMARLFVPHAPIDEALRGYFRSFNLVVSYLFDPDSIFRGNIEAIGVGTFLEASHQVTAGAGHAAMQLARPLQRIAMFLENPAARLDITPAPPPTRPILALHPGSGSLQKNWSPENWARLGGGLAETFPGLDLALVTGEAEAERGITPLILEGWRGFTFHHWDQLPLTELASRLASSRCFIGHDSGISHLAAACALPCLLFFGPTDPATWAPAGPEIKTITAPAGDLRGLSHEGGRVAAEEFVREIMRKNSAPTL